MRFVDLLLPPSPSPTDQQLEASRKFPELVAASHLHLWRPGDPIHSGGLRLLIGISASYAVKELELLDMIDAALLGGPEKVCVDVFDLATCRAQEDVRLFFPGITKVVQTPILGIWSLGHLTEVIQGFYARERALALLAGR